jgi:hypothetical protein
MDAIELRRRGVERVPVRRAGLPRSPLAITLLGWAWPHLRTRLARNAAP